MKKNKKNANNRGSVTVMAIGIMVFLGIILAGVLPMITQEVRSGTMNRDVIEAQYAAEAGAKRAIVNFSLKSTDWSWVGTKRNLATDATKTYLVTTSPAVVNGSQAAANSYTITSVGQVGSATKTVTVTLASGATQAPVLPLVAADAGIYAGGNIEFKNKGVVNNASTAAGGNNSDSYNMGGLYQKVQYSTLTMPDYLASSFPGAQSIPGGSNKNLSGQYIINGNWSMANNTSITGDATIYVTGNIVLPQNFNFNGQFLIIAAGNIDGGNSNNNNFSKSILIAYGNIDFKNGLNLNGSMMAAGNVSLNNNANINFDPSLIQHFNIASSMTGNQAQWKSQ